MSTNLLQVGTAADGQAVDALESGFVELRLGLRETQGGSENRLRGE